MFYSLLPHAVTETGLQQSCPFMMLSLRGACVLTVFKFITFLSYLLLSSRVMYVTVFR